jgi:hypothetical protein
MTFLSNKLDANEFTSSEKKVDAEKSSKASSSETWLSELWHSTKYAFAQSTYDAVKQDVNHLAGAISKGSAPLPDHQFVEPVPWRHDQSAVGIAQDVGTAIGAAPYAVAVNLGLRKLFPESLIAKSLPLMAGESTERAANVLRVGMTGGILGGVLTPVDENGDWAKNKLKNATAGFTSFAVAGAGMEYFGGGQLASKLMPENGLSGSFAQSALRRVENAAVTAASGGTASFMNTETNSLLFDHKLASPDELTKNSLKTVALMATLSALQPGFGKSFTEKDTHFKQGGTNTPVSEVRLPREQVQVPKTSEQITADAKAREDSSIPRPPREAKVRPENDMEAKPDTEQAARLEKQAKSLAAKGLYAESASRLVVALDCLEGAKALGRSVDQAHLKQLYRTLAKTTLKADKP